MLLLCIQIYFPFTSKGWGGKPRKWGECKAEFVGFGTSTINVWADDIEEDDVKQGALGDGYFLCEVVAH